MARYRGVGACSADGLLDAIAVRVAAGATVEFRPSGSSMVPLIRSRQSVTVAPVDATTVETGDIVLARVAGTAYLHLVSATDTSGSRVQISNNRGRVNGWTNHARIYGICGSRRRSPTPRCRQGPSALTAITRPWTPDRASAQR
jgi:hypothetical protein